MILKRRTRNLKSETGAELVELALTLPMLLFVLLAICDFGFLFQKQAIIANAAREGVRFGSMSNVTPTDIDNRVQAYVQASGLDTQAGNPTVVVTPTTLSAAGSTFQAMQVDVFYFHDYTFLAPIADWFGGGFTSVTLNARSVMRRETAGS